MATGDSRPTSKSFIDLTGHVYGRLTVLEWHSKDARGQSSWLCRCECGVEKPVRGLNLRNGSAASCGCYCREMHREVMRKTMTRHGKSQTPEYATWSAMMGRCHGENNSGTYDRYRASGITVCERWQTFENFLADMGERPTPKHTIERIRNDRGYEPDNCEWATMLEQGQNRTNSRLYTHDGLTLTLSAWSRRLGIARQMLHYRLAAGKSFEEAISTPSKRARFNESIKI